MNLSVVSMLVKQCGKLCSTSSVSILVCLSIRISLDISVLTSVGSGEDDESGEDERGHGRGSGLQRSFHLSSLRSSEAYKESESNESSGRVSTTVGLSSFHYQKESVALCPRLNPVLPRAVSPLQRKGTMLPRGPSARTRKAVK